MTIEEHREWFQKAVKSPDHCLSIMHHLEQPLGIARLHRVDATKANISIFLMKEFCGKGYGTQAIQQLCEKGWSLWPIKEIHAYVLRTNAASEKSFLKSDFSHYPKKEGDESSSLMHLFKVRPASPD